MPNATVSALPPSLHVHQLIGRLPTTRRFAFGAIRMCITLICCSVLWEKTPLETTAGEFYRHIHTGLTDAIFTWKTEEKLVPSEENPDQLKKVYVKTRKIVPFSLDPEIYFNMLIPIVIVSMLPIKPILRTLSHVVAATVVMVIYNICQTLAHGYHAYSLRRLAEEGVEAVNTTSVEIIVFALNCYIAPIFAVILAMFMVDRCSRIVSRTSPVARIAAPANRNSPCPCGSGRKYKKCCGSAS